MHCSKGSRSKSQGFTLIELLVVIAIIAILAAILFPVFAQARDKARQTACLSNTKQIALALAMYTQDYDETYPGPFLQVPPINGGTLDRIPLECQLQPYIKSTGVWSCPNQAAPPKGLGLGNMWDGSYEQNSVARSYTYCGAIRTVAGGTSENDKNTGVTQYTTIGTDSSDWGRPGATLAAIDQPADTIAVVETRGFNGNDQSRSEGSAGDAAYGTAWGSLFTGCDTYKLAGRNKGQDADVVPGCTAPFNSTAGIKGHQSQGNYVFADGHAKSLTYGAVRKNDFFLFKKQKPTTVVTP